MTRACHNVCTIQNGLQVLSRDNYFFAMTTEAVECRCNKHSARSSRVKQTIRSRPQSPHVKARKDVLHRDPSRAPAASPQAPP